MFNWKHLRGRLTDSFHLNLTAFGLLSFAVGLFIVHGASDVRVPVGHAYRLRDALDEIGKKPEVTVVISRLA